MSVNKVILVGNLGADPEIRKMPSGGSVCTLRIATARTWKEKESGQKKEETEWHSVVLYDRLADIAGEYLKKGRPVYIEGRLKTRKWQDKDGVDRYSTDVVANELVMLGSNGRGQPRGEGGDDGGAPARRASQRSGAGRSSSKSSGSSSSPKAAAKRIIQDDDIPF
jgi:single-strand DNA-binding protein